MSVTGNSEIDYKEAFKRYFSELIDLLMSLQIHSFFIRMLFFRLRLNILISLFIIRFQAENILVLFFNYSL